MGTSPLADHDRDGIPAGLEYFFGTSPLQPDGNLVESALVHQGDLKSIRLVFPRRAGLLAGYQSTGDFITWNPLTNAQETKGRKMTKYTVFGSDFGNSQSRA